MNEKRKILGLMMPPCVIHFFDLFLLFIGIYSVHMFPIENEVINKVYHELRDIVQLASKTSNTSSNTTQSKATRNDTHNDAVYAIDVTDANISTISQNNEHLLQRNADNSAINKLFNLSSRSDVSFKNNSIQKSNISIVSGNLTALGIVFDRDEINSNVSSNQSESILTSLQYLQNSKEKERLSNNISQFPAQIITKRQIWKAKQTEEIVSDIYTVLPLRLKRKIEPIVLTNKIKDILDERNRKIGEAESLITKREREEDGKIYDKLSQEIKDILPQKKWSKSEILSRREKRQSGKKYIMDDKVTSKFDDLMPIAKWNGKEILKTKRESNDDSLEDGELTNEIDGVYHIQGSVDAQHDQREKVHTSDNHGDNFRRGLQEIIWRRQPTSNASSDESSHIPNNHMYHAEHGHHYVRHHSSNIPNDYREDDNRDGEDNEDEREWHKYHHKKFHHVKFKLHGEGKTPSEWAKQEAKELADQSVIYHQGAYHAIDNLPDNIAAGYIQLHCKDCIISSY